MLVKVRLDGAGDYTYEARAGIAIGDRVEVEGPFWMPDTTRVGVVVALGSDYAGIVKPILRVLSREEGSG